MKNTHTEHNTSQHHTFTEYFSVFYRARSIGGGAMLNPTSLPESAFWLAPTPHVVRQPWPGFRQTLVQPAPLGAKAYVTRRTCLVSGRRWKLKALVKPKAHVADFASEKKKSGDQIKREKGFNNLTIRPS